MTSKIVRRSASEDDEESSSQHKLHQQQQQQQQEQQQQQLPVSPKDAAPIITVITLAVRSFTGQLFDVSLPLAASVEELKQNIAAHLGTSDVDAFQLVSHGTVLETGSLASHALQNGSRVDIVPRLRTGRGAPSQAAQLASIEKFLTDLASAAPDQLNSPVSVSFPVGNQTITLKIEPAASRADSPMPGQDPPPSPSAPSRSSSRASSRAAAASSAHHPHRRQHPSMSGGGAGVEASEAEPDDQGVTLNPSTMSPAELLRQFQQLQTTLAREQQRDDGEDQEDADLPAEEIERRRRIMQAMADKARTEAAATRQRATDNKRTASKLEELQAKMRAKRAHRDRAHRATHTVLPSGLPAPAFAPVSTSAASAAVHPQSAPTFGGLRRGFLPQPQPQPTAPAPVLSPSTGSSTKASTSPKSKATFGGLKRGFLTNPKKH